MAEQNRGSRVAYMKRLGSDEKLEFMKMQMIAVDLVQRGYQACFGHLNSVLMCSCNSCSPKSMDHKISRCRELSPCFHLYSSTEWFEAERSGCRRYTIQGIFDVLVLIIWMCPCADSKEVFLKPGCWFVGPFRPVFHGVSTY